MAQSLGELYTTLSLKTGSYFKDVEEAADAIEELGSKAVSALGDVSEGFLSVAAGAAGFVAVASGFSAPVKAEVDKLTGAVKLFSVEVATTMLPLVRELTGWVKTGVAWWRSLSDETKGNIVSMVKWAAIIGGVGMALSRVILFAKGFAEALVVAIRFGNGIMGLRSVATIAPLLDKLGWSLVYLKNASVGDVFRSMGDSAKSFKATLADLPSKVGALAVSFQGAAASTWAMAAPVLAVMAAVAALVVLVASLRASWGDLGLVAKDFGWAIEDAVATGTKALGGMLATAGRVISGVFSGLKDFVVSVLDAGLTAILEKVKFVARAAEVFARGAGATDTANELAKVQDLNTQELLGAGMDRVEALWTKAGERLDTVMSAVGVVAEETGKRLKADGKWALGKVLDPLGATGEGGILNFGVGKENVQKGLDLFMGDFTKWFAELRAGIPGLPSGRDVEDAAAQIALAESFSAVGPTQGMDRAVAKAQGFAGPSAGYAAYLKAVEEAAKKAALDMAAALQKARDEFYAGLGDKVLGAMGAAGDLTKAIMDGLAAGGPVGALVAVGVEMLTRSKAFQETMGMLDGIISEVADGLFGFIAGLQPVVAVLGDVLGVVVQALQPALTSVGEVLAMLAPPLMLVGMLVAGLAPILEILTLPLKALELPLRFLFEVLRGVSLIVLAVVNGIALAWNGILSGVQALLKGLGLGQWAKDLESLRIDTSAIDEAMNDLAAVTLESADAAARKAAEDRKAADAAEALSEGLLNAPSAWKRAAASYMAQDSWSPEGGAPPAPGGGGSSDSGSGPGFVVEGDINIIAADPDEAMGALHRKVDEITFTRRGKK